MECLVEWCDVEWLVSEVCIGEGLVGMWTVEWVHGGTSEYGVVGDVAS